MAAKPRQNNSESESGSAPNPSFNRRSASPLPAAALRAFSPTPSNGCRRATVGSGSPDKAFVSLFEWWVVRVKGDEGKVAVAGFTTRNETIQIFTSAPIVKRYDASMLETADGVIILIQGILNISQMHENGFSLEVCDRFLNGFPIWWDNCTDLYASKTVSYIESQPSSSVTSTSHKGSTQAYLEKFLLGGVVNSLGSSFMGNPVDTAKRFSRNDANAVPFRKCSYLSSGLPRFEESNCDDNDNSMRVKTASAINDDSKGCVAVYNGVGNKEMNLTTGSASREGCPGDANHLTLSLAHAETCNIDGANKEAENQTENMCRYAREQEDVNHPVNSVMVYNRTTDHLSCDLEDGTTKYCRNLVDMRLKDFLTPVSFEVTSCPPPDLAEDLDKAMNMHERNELRQHRVSPTNNMFYSDVSEEIVGVLNLGCERTHEASLKRQGYQKRIQHRALNEKMVPNEDITTSIPSDVRSCEGIPKVSLKKQGYRKRTELKALNEQMVPNKEITTSVPSDVKSLENKQRPLGPLEDESPASKVLQSNTRSQMKKTPMSYAHQSPLTRGKAKSLSVSTPESLKLRRTRSGRVVVPRLDSASQSILYDRDGSISGITNFQSPPKGRKSEPPVKRRKTSR